MAKGYSSGRGYSAGGRGSSSGSSSGSGRSGSGATAGNTGSSRGATGSSPTGFAKGGSGSPQRAANTRMWSQPATPNQIAALQAHGNYDGKYYSKGRAGQTIGASARSGGGRSVPSAGPGSPQQAIGALSALVTFEDASASNFHDTSAPSAIDRNLNFVPLEGNTMSQLVPVANATVPNIASVVEMSAHVPANVIPFEFIGDLERKHLAAVAKQVGRAVPAQVRALEKGWAQAKVTMAAMFARAHLELVSILQQAPSGSVASPEATAREMLWNACSADLEKQLLEAAHEAHGSTKPTQVLDEWLAQVGHRIEMAKIYAQGQVDVAKIQASLPPAPARGYEPSWGEVTGLKPFGAFIRLQSGESGLLHKSELRSLNGGRDVEDAAPLFNVGQWVHVRVTGKNEEGKLNFALVA